jgi:hypothetical protein
MDIDWKAVEPPTIDVAIYIDRASAADPAIGVAMDIDKGTLKRKYNGDKEGSQTRPRNVPSSQKRPRNVNPGHAQFAPIVTPFLEGSFGVDQSDDPSGRLSRQSFHRG